MEIHYPIILTCGLLAMALGAVWYGPLFGKRWMRIIGATEIDVLRRKEMQKRAIPLYIIQFVLALFQAYVLFHFIKGWGDASGMETSLWIFGAFIVPTVAAASMWNNDSREVAWSRFLIQAGYYLVLFVAFGYIITTWG